MRFWITKNSELPIREQLVRQVVLGILSEDLPAGHKLPSVRAMARRHHIHANTVSAAYHDLLQQGWLELRRGSGLYVRPPIAAANAQSELERLLIALLATARSHGWEPEEVLRRLEHLVRPRAYERVLVVEPDPAMREILLAELAEHLGARVAATSANETGLEQVSSASQTLAVALPTRAPKVRRALPPYALLIPLRVRSARQSLEGQSRPAPDVVISIVSRSAEIRQWAHALLIAVGLDPESLSEVDAARPGWQDRIGRGSLAVTDVVTARELPAGCLVKEYRVIADSSISELKQLCSA
ncbi:MAG TPA: GntR family transcriptional regulator [Bryobacteraceae bacterium]|nr:GntR family transcriptional regulator [Bryobacteraceae bacterium]